MKDKLEEFIRDHREQLDNKTPREGAWAGISNTIFGGNAASIWSSVSLWRAAAILMMGLSTYLYLSNSGKVNSPQQIVMQQDFTDIESFYSAQILEKVALISTEDQFADDSFTQDIQKLEAMYTVLAEEMKRHPSQKVKDALVLNMLVRIDLLNQQIQKLEETKRRKSETAVI